MVNTVRQLPVLSGMLATILILSACGGGGGGGDTQITDENSGSSISIVNDDGTPVVPEVGDESSSTVDIGAISDSSDAPSVMSAGSALNGDVDFESFNLYQVPSGSEVVLRVESGSARLFLYDSLALEDENLRCASNLDFGESACTASVDDGELYALVYGYSAASYTISDTDDCSVPAVNGWVDRNMRDYYLYSDQVPPVDPAAYDSPEALIQDLRFNSLEPFSSVQDAQSQSDFSELGITKSLGLFWGRDTQGTPRIRLVYENSPFGRAGIKRGDIIVAINDEPWDEITSERYNELVGTSDNPLVTNWTFIDSSTGETIIIEAQLKEFTVNTVLYSGLLTHPDYSGTIGYLAFKSFIETSEGELDTAFEFFEEQQITDLVLDLRYNGGGRTRIARLLASKIAGPFTDDQLFSTTQYNNKYTDRNNSDFFASEDNALGLNRLVVITSEGTASSSELVINALRPYIEVVTVGGLTVGKPFISRANDFCGKSLNAMEAQGVNADNVSVAGGITADCYAADDLTRDFGIRTTDDGVQVEGMLRSAADYFVFGTCDASPVAARQSTEEVFGEVEPYVAEEAD